MSRMRRTDCVGLYHVINRGVEKRIIFLDNPDRFRFLSLVDEQKATFDFDVVAYCLMPNHYHLLIETRFENLSGAIKGLNQQYAQYFNKKYDRVGGLWQGRFKSWFVHNEKYLRVLVKYIERNPIKAGMTLRIGEYPWASSVTEDPALSPDDIAQLTEFFSTKYLPQDGLCWGAPPDEPQPHGVATDNAVTAAHEVAAAGPTNAAGMANPTRTVSPAAAAAHQATTAIPTPAFRKTLQQHFLVANLSRKRYGAKRSAKDEAIGAALRDGYSQLQIAHHLGITPAAISKRVKLINGV